MEVTLKRVKGGYCSDCVFFDAKRDSECCISTYSCRADVVFPCNDGKWQYHWEEVK